ncbi:hypothetical protein [Kribbella sp.]|uniref:hypothetical protein n=1 Tax=Kribbella sp. TaxID=1871183 RepID=UPI002D30A164|nr:hypothetical protein [Kribbella sp.]HZX03629.1 hypothetical protein [Kribbella sp.]
MQDQVINLTTELAGSDEPGEGFLAKTGRLNAAGSRAEELVLHELLSCQKPQNEPEMREDIASYHEGVNDAIQELHDLRRQLSDDTEPNGR